MNNDIVLNKVGEKPAAETDVAPDEQNSKLRAAAGIAAGAAVVSAAAAAGMTEEDVPARTANETAVTLEAQTAINNQAGQHQGAQTAADAVNAAVSNGINPAQAVQTGHDVQNVQEYGHQSQHDATDEAEIVMADDIEEVEVSDIIEAVPQNDGVAYQDVVEPMTTVEEYDADEFYQGNVSSDFGDDNLVEL